jgi:AcrR family transcriptional regulator
MARPSTQEQRRADILAAASRLMERHDQALLRLADIAAELELTPNAIRYYYDDIDKLLEALLERSIERFYTARLAALDGIKDAGERLAVTIAAGLPNGAEDAEWRVIWRAILSAGFELNHRPEINSNYHRQVDLYAGIFAYGARRGRFRLSGTPVELGRTIMSLEDYLGYRIVARDPMLSRADGLLLVRGYAELATDSTLPDVP